MYIQFKAIGRTISRASVRHVSFGDQGVAVVTIVAVVVVTVVVAVAVAVVSIAAIVG